MDYLNNTLIFLQEENKELKNKIKRFQNLQNILISQRNSENKQFLTRLHEEEIKVIREIAAESENKLRQQIKQLKKEVQQLTENLLKGEDEMMILRKQIKVKEGQKEDIKMENDRLQAYIGELKLQAVQIQYRHQQDCQKIQEDYEEREREVIDNYGCKLDQVNERHEEENNFKQRVIQGQIKKLENNKHEKEMLEKEISRLVRTLKASEIKNQNTIKKCDQQKEKLTKEKEEIDNKLKIVEIQLAKTQQRLRQEQQKRKSLEQSLQILKKKFAQLEHTKQRELQKQKLRTLSVCKDLSEHKKYLKGQTELSKRKQREYNQSKKQLIGRIKDMESKPSSCKNNQSVIIDKTTQKTTKKSNYQTYQSISLDNSFTKDSPSVSCFLVNEKPQNRSQLAKKPLTIDTSNQQTVLKFENLDTPCFESTREATKKTIKIKR